MLLTIPVTAPVASACVVSPRFQEIVRNELGPTQPRARQASFGLAVYRRGTNELLCEDYFEGDQSLMPASTIKTLVALAVFRLVDAAKLRLEDPIAITQANAAIECADSNCAVYGPGKIVQVQKLLFDMLVNSNNIATNQLIDLATKDFINSTADLLEASSLRVYRKLYNQVSAEPQNTRRNTATARGLIQMYREIAMGTGKMLSLRSRSLLLGLLHGERGYLGTRFPQRLMFWHKSGTTSDSSSDAGFYLIGNDTVVLIAALQGFRDFQTLSDIGASVYDLLQRQPRESTPRSLK